MAARFASVLLFSFGAWFAFSAPSSVAEISLTEQGKLLGAGGPDTSCSGASTCTACVPPSVCTPHWLWSECVCTTPGSEGCATAAAFNVCSPQPGGSCDQTGGTAACGAFQQPQNPTATLVAGVWTCPAATCTTGSAGSPYCTNCL